VIEQYKDAVLIRPGADYVGSKAETFVPLDQRA